MTCLQTATVSSVDAVAAHTTIVLLLLDDTPMLLLALLLFKTVLPLPLQSAFKRTLTCTSTGE